MVVLGLALFITVGDPAGGKDNAPGKEWAIATAIVVLASIGLIALGGRGPLERKAGTYGAAAGPLYGLSASLCKPTVDLLDADGLGSVLTSWELSRFRSRGSRPS